MLPGLNIILRRGIAGVASTRCGFHSSSQVLVDERWKAERGLPLNPLHNHEFKEWSDYSFVDGRKVPLSAHQYDRWKTQRELASKAVQLLGDVNYAYQKHYRLEEEKEMEKQRRLSSKLKPKGSKLPLSKKPLL